jgi:serine/threonine-protein kinase HipA
VRHDELHLWFLADPQRPRLVGHLRLVDGGKGVSLRYAPAWLATGFALSEDLPLADIEHLPRWPGMAVGAVDDARPDRWGERVIQYVDRPARRSLMEYLYYAGDDRHGALGVSTSADAYLPRMHGPLPRLEEAQALSEVVHKVQDKAPIGAAERRLLSAGGSFGGAKPKALIDIAGESWLIKFFNNEPVDVPLIEHAAMTLAAKAGITVAETRLLPLVGEHALAVRRYDRAGSKRIHCLSAGTALRAQTIAGLEPDLGYPALAQLLRRIGVAEGGLNRQDMHELFRRMVFNILIDNTDDHEKNHGLTVMDPTRQGRIRLAPAYDVLPTLSGQGAQEFNVGIDLRDSTLANAMSQCELFGHTVEQAAEEVHRVIQVVDGWRDHFASVGVTPADLENLARSIDGEALLEQRKGFDPARHATPAKLARRRGPFAR